MAIQGYDLVGDVHGHADPLHLLLDKLDYTEVEGVFRHPERMMIFVGDFVDRGPQQREVLRIARSMCEAGVAMAVMGNHEFNAIGWAAQNNDGKFLRSHSEKNARQHSKFLRQIEEDSADHQDAVGWFRSLPIWLDLPGLRVVHACWHEPSFLDEAGRFTEEGILESYRHGSDAHLAVEILLKGPEERLPAGIHFFDKDGHKREEVASAPASARGTTVTIPSYASYAGGVSPRRGRCRKIASANSSRRTRRVGSPDSSANPVSTCLSSIWRWTWLHQNKTSYADAVWPTSAMCARAHELNANLLFELSDLPTEGC